MHMVKCGARELIFLGRSGAKGKEDYVQELRNLGVTVHIVAGNAANREDVRRALRQAKNPMRGVIQSTLILKVFISLLSTT